MNISLLLEMAADALADRAAIGSAGGGLSYAALIAEARKAAAWIAQHDAAHVVYLGYNAPAFPILLFASAIAGRPFVPLNYRLPDADLRRLAARTAPSLVVADDALAARIAGIEGVTITSSSAFLDRIAGRAPANADPD